VLLHMLAAENGTNSPFAAPQRFRPESRGQLTLGGRRWAARRTAGVGHNRREIVEEAFAGKGKYRSANGGTLH